MKKMGKKFYTKLGFWIPVSIIIFLLMVGIFWVLIRNNICWESRVVDRVNIETGQCEFTSSCDLDANKYVLDNKCLEAYTNLKEIQWHPDYNEEQTNLETLDFCNKYCNNSQSDKFAIYCNETYNLLFVRGPEGLSFNCMEILN